MIVGILSFLWREDLNASETMKTTDSVDEDHLFWISLLSKTTFIHTHTHICAGRGSERTGVRHGGLGGGGWVVRCGWI